MSHGQWKSTFHLKVTEANTLLLPVTGFDGQNMTETVPFLSLAQESCSCYPTACLSQQSLGQLLADGRAGATRPITPVNSQPTTRHGGKHSHPVQPPPDLSWAQVSQPEPTGYSLDSDSPNRVSLATRWWVVCGAARQLMQHCQPSILCSPVGVKPLKVPRGPASHRGK